MRDFLTWILSMLFAPPWVRSRDIPDDWRGLPEPNYRCRRWGSDYL